MCGFFLVLNIKNYSDNKSINYDFARECSQNISHRGPDKSNEFISANGSFFSHHRLSIIDPSEYSSQPFISNNRKQIICFNGEVYNYKKLALELLDQNISGDTEVIAEIFSRYNGLHHLEKFDGMYAFCSYDLYKNDYFLIRDPIGIKPLYYKYFEDQLIVCSESYPISMWCGSKIDPLSEEEIRIFRRPTPGNSFFEGVNELLPGTYLTGSYNSKPQRWKNSSFNISNENFSNKKIENLLIESIILNTVSDVPLSGFQSGGFDSTIVTNYANPSQLYSVGFKHDNEFEVVKKISKLANIPVSCLEINSYDFKEIAYEYLKIKREPISVPNEVLIYALCKHLGPKRKVFLTGEGADEIFFGYDRIFRWADKYGIIKSQEEFIYLFLHKYAYTEFEKIPYRIINYAFELIKNKKIAIDFVEDFFLNFHLPGLLMRADKSSMAAGKEARVPFCSKSLVDFMYRRPIGCRFNKKFSKIPLREILLKTKFSFVSKIPKIGFRTIMPNMDTKEMYKFTNNLYYKLNN